MARSERHDGVDEELLRAARERVAGADALGQRGRARPPAMARSPRLGGSVCRTHLARRPPGALAVGYASCGDVAAPHMRGAYASGREQMGTCLVSRPRERRVDLARHADRRPVTRTRSGRQGLRRVVARIRALGQSMADRRRSLRAPGGDPPSRLRSAELFSTDIAAPSGISAFPIGQRSLRCWVRYRDGNGQGWADLIDLLTMYPDARRRVVRMLGELEAETRRARAGSSWF